MILLLLVVVIVLLLNYKINYLGKIKLFNFTVQLEDYNTSIYGFVFLISSLFLVKESLSLRDMFQISDCYTFRGWKFLQLSLFCILLKQSIFLYWYKGIFFNLLNCTAPLPYISLRPFCHFNHLQGNRERGQSRRWELLYAKSQRSCRWREAPQGHFN